MSDGNENGRVNILEPELQRFVERDSDERLSVLVELEAEPPEILIGERGWGMPSPRPLAISGRDDNATAARLARLHKAVAVIVGKVPVCLDSAEALVADVTAAQLRQVAQLAEVGCIRLNRRHRLG
jgi:hypothetical protein